MSTATLGVLGVLFTLWQVWLNGFRPDAWAYIDIGQEAIQVHVFNRGRGQGTITRIVVMTAEGLGVGGTVVHGADTTFPPTTLAGRAKLEATFTRPNATFQLSDRVKVEWGKSEAVVKPSPVDVGLIGVP